MGREIRSMFDEELEKLRKVVEGWIAIPLAQDCPDELFKLDNQMNEWYGDLEEAFASVEAAATADERRRP